MTMTRDPGMDQNPDVWQSPEIDPDFRDAIPQHPVGDNDADPYGTVHFPDATEMHNETIQAIRQQSASLARLIRVLTDVNKRIDRIDAGQTISRSARLRVRWLIVSRVTAGVATLTIGTESYPFNVGTVPIRIDFPLVIENGIDIGFTGDGTLYIVSDPE